MGFFFANCAGAARGGAEDASTIRKTIDTIHGKLVTFSETVARRRRDFFRISGSKIYFVKENKHENSPPQANFLRM